MTKPGVSPAKSQRKQGQVGRQAPPEVLCPQEDSAQKPGRNRGWGVEVWSRQLTNFLGHKLASETFP